MNHEETDDSLLDDPECKAAARSLIVAAERLHRAIAAASPERGQALLAVLRLAGCAPVATVHQTDVGTYEVHVGLIDRDTGKNLALYEHTLVRTDVSPLPVLSQFAH